MARAIYRKQSIGTSRFKLAQKPLTVITVLFVWIAAVVADGFDHTSETDNFDLVTGPDVGEKIPYFRGLDQHGKYRTFDDIKGPNGAMILFHRSADW